MARYKPIDASWRFIAVDLNAKARSSGVSLRPQYDLPFMRWLARWRVTRAALLIN